MQYEVSLDVIVLLQASPEQTKKQQEDADRAMENNHEKNRQGEQEPKDRDDSEAGRELPVPQEHKSVSGKAMTGQRLRLMETQRKLARCFYTRCAVLHQLPGRGWEHAAPLRDRIWSCGRDKAAHCCSL